MVFGDGPVVDNESSSLTSATMVCDCDRYAIHLHTSSLVTGEMKRLEFGVIVVGVFTCQLLA